MDRYKKERRLVDLSILPLFPMMARRTVITDTKTGKQAKAHDRQSFNESDRKAWDKLKRQK